MSPTGFQDLDAAKRWFREAGFGLFIHWGLYAIPAGFWMGQPVRWLGEWIMNTARIPVWQYEQLAKLFNPTRFDARQWVALADAAGMGYLVFTAKHHDGFAMFHSKADHYNIVDATPFKHDPTAELAQACRGTSVRLALYYSQAQDWHEGLQLAPQCRTDGGREFPTGSDRAASGDGTASGLICVRQSFAVGDQSPHLHGRDRLVVGSTNIRLRAFACTS